MNEEAGTEIDEKEKLDSNNETSIEIDPAMKKYSDFISFSTNYEKNAPTLNRSITIRMQINTFWNRITSNCVDSI